MTVKSTRRALSRDSVTRLNLALCSTVVIIFVLEMLTHLLVRGLPPLSAFAGALIDSTLLSIPALPALYFFVIVPLARHAARHEQAERALTESEARLRRAEKKYRSIFEHALDGIYQTTPSGTFITANTAMARILGHESAEALMAQLTDRSGWGSWPRAFLKRPATPCSGWPLARRRCGCSIVMRHRCTSCSAMW